ncbi:MAG TPA: non-ribosomal peptide synthetase, partial [Pseudomonas nitrititolerans]|nr:non-ribosomal peptide synthetase [Stutzerimonas nitrititolerans]
MKPLGIAQQGLWSGYLLNEDRAMFNTAECIAFAGKVRSAELIGAVQRAVAECEALSGVFVTDQEAVFFATCNLPLEVRQMRIPEGIEAETWARDWAMSDIRLPMDLEQQLPCRF